MISPLRYGSTPFFKESSAGVSPVRSYIRGRMDEAEFNTRNRLRYVFSSKM